MGYIGKVPADVLIDPHVDSAAITDGTIITADIADDAVTSAKLAQNSVDSSELIDGSVDNSHLAGSIAVNKTLLSAGTGLTLSTNTLNVDAAQSQITSVGTLTSLNVSGNAVISGTLQSDDFTLDAGSGNADLVIKTSASSSATAQMLFLTGDKDFTLINDTGNFKLYNSTPGVGVDVFKVIGSSSDILFGDVGNSRHLSLDYSNGDVVVNGNGLGVGVVPDSTELIHAQKDQSAFTRILVENESTSTTSQALFGAKSNAGVVNIGITPTQHSFSGDAILWNTANTGIRFATNNTQALNIDSSQNATFEGNVQLNNGQQFQWGGTSNAIFGHHTNNYVTIKTGGLDRFTINSSGDTSFTEGVAINGASLGSHKLVVDNGTTSFNRGNSSGNILELRGLNSSQVVFATGETTYGTSSVNNNVRVHGNLRMNAANSVSFQNASANETVSLWNGGASNETVLYSSGGIELTGTTNSQTSGKGRGQINASGSIGLNASTTWKTVRTLYGGYQSGILVFHVHDSGNAANTRCQIYAYNADYYERGVSSIDNVTAGVAPGGIEVQIVRDDGSTTSDGGGPYHVQARPANGTSALTVRLLILSAGD